MRRLALVFLLFVSCTPPPPMLSPTADPSVAALPPPSPAAPPAATSLGAPTCAPPLRPLTPTTASFTLLPHQIGPLVVFGLDGSFVASAYAYPLGASQHWSTLDTAGNPTSDFTWRFSGEPIQSPDGARVIYAATDPATSERALYVRELSGAPRHLIAGSASPSWWVDPFRVLIVDPMDHSAVYAIDTRTAAKDALFRVPPPHPTLPLTTGEDWPSLSGDLKWALIHRTNADRSFVRTDLYDVARREYVNDTVPSVVMLSPRGDIAIWFEGYELKAMHLCDRRVFTLMAIASAPTQLIAQRFSPDGRYFSFSLGLTDEQHGPQRTIVADLERGLVADLTDTWGTLQRWSPGDEYVVLARSTYHAPSVRLARFSMP